MIKAWFATFTRRWHTNHDLSHTVDTVGDHSARVAILMLQIYPQVSREALIAALVHDLGESVAGDLPATFKQSSPELAVVLAGVENTAIREMGITNPRLSTFEARLLKLCDSLDAYLWARHHKPSVLSGDGWPECKDFIEATAARLGVYVAPYLEDVECL